MARLPGDRGLLRLRAGRRAVLLVEEQPGLGRGLLPLLQEHVLHTGKNQNLQRFSGKMDAAMAIKLSFKSSGLSYHPRSTVIQK